MIIYNNFFLTPVYNNSFLTIVAIHQSTYTVTIKTKEKCRAQLTKRLHVTKVNRDSYIIT